MKNKKTALVLLIAFLCSCSQGNTATTAVQFETTASVSEETTTATEETTTQTEKTDVTTKAETTAEETTTTEGTTTAEEITTATTTAETTTTTEAETTVTTTVEETTTTVQTTVSTTTVPETTTKKTKKTTTTAETTVPETTTTPEITTIPETAVTTTVKSGIFPQEDGSLMINGDSYKPTFSDDFGGNKLDLSKWEKCPEWKRQDLDCYWDDNCAYVENGNLVLLSEEIDGEYHMGGIRSKKKFEQAYGYFEVRCTLNTTPGYWTAFWLMGETVANENDSGTDGTEIDIMESAYFGRGVQHTLNWDGYGQNHKVSGYIAENSGLYDGGYHTFSLLWTEDEYIFYIDGEESWRTAAEEAGGTCTVPLYLKFTAETGSWTAWELTDETFPDTVCVDYIKVYSKA